MKSRAGAIFPCRACGPDRRAATTTTALGMDSSAAGVWRQSCAEGWFVEGFGLVEDDGMLVKVLVYWRMISEIVLKI